MPKLRHNYVHRRTTGGGGVRDIGGPVGPSPAGATGAFNPTPSTTETTSLILQAAEGAGQGWGNVYPIMHVTGDPSRTFGQTSGALPLAYDNGGGSDPHRSGYKKITGGSVVYQYNEPAGPVTFWCDVASPFILFTGTPSDVSYSSWYAWGSNSNYGPGLNIISSVDGSAWKMAQNLTGSFTAVISGNTLILASATTTGTALPVGTTVIPIAAGGAGTILANDVINFDGDGNSYAVATGIADLSTGGQIVLKGTGLKVAVPAAATAITAAISGWLLAGQTLAGTGVAAGQTIVSGSGTTWALSIPQADVAAEAMTTYSVTTTEPSGNADSFDDGLLVWVRVKRPSGTPLTATSFVMPGTATGGGIFSQDNDASNSAPTTVSAWLASAGRNVTTNDADGTGFTLMFWAGGTYYPESFGIRPQTVPLVNVTLNNDYDEPMGSSPKIYCLQPLGIPVAKIVTYGGPASVNGLALSGPMAAYFALDYFDLGRGTELYFKQTASIPDSLATLNGSTAAQRTCYVDQTDPDASPSVHRTTFVFDVISSQGRDLSDVPATYRTEAYLARKKIVDFVSSKIRPRFVGPCYSINCVRDTVVHSAAEWRQEILDLMALNGGAGPTKNATYRIRLNGNGAGAYEGVITDAIQLDFGPTGRLLIELDANSDPEVACGFSNVTISGLEIRGNNTGSETQSDMRIILLASRIGGAFFSFQAPGSLGVYNSYSIHHLKPGSMWAAGASQSQLFNSGGGHLTASFITNACALAVDVSDIQINGCFNVVNLYGIKAAKLFRIDIQCTSGDVYPTSPVSGETGSNSFKWTSTGLFPDNDSYIWRDTPTARNQADYPGIHNAEHADWMQTRRNGWGSGNSYPYRAFNQFPGGQMFNPTSLPYPGAYYTARSTTTGVAYPVGNGPQGTANGQVDGGIVWDYLGAYTLRADIYLVEENTSCDNSVQYDTSQYMGGRQYLIDSNGGKNCALFGVFLNVLYCNTNSDGITFADGEVMVENVTFGMPATLPPGRTPSAAHVQGQGGAPSSPGQVQKARVRNSVIPGGVSANKISVQNVSGVGFYPGSLPEAVFNGPFTTNTSGTSNNGWRGFARDDGTTTPAQFIANIRSIFSPLTAAGAFGAAIVAPIGWTRALLRRFGVRFH
ncbi:MAG: hypothetical protein ACRYG4_17210 [Janthinobacterium lividum]